MLLSFQSALDDKDIEIKRLKEGFETEILRKNLINIASIHEKSSQMLKKEPENNLLKNFIFLLTDVLKDSGVEITEIPVGRDFALFSDFIEVIGTTSKTLPAMEKGQITEVSSPSYVLKGLDYETVLLKAKIKYHLPEGEK